MGSTCDYNKNRKQPKSSINYKVDNNPFIEKENAGNDGIPKKAKKTRSIKKDKILSSKKSLKIESEKVAFPPGENYYQLIKDSNSSELIKKGDSLSEKVELFFSLTSIENPDDEYSFGISIINSTRIGIITYLGKLENRTGKEIEFGTSFVVDFFLKEIKN